MYSFYVYLPRKLLNRLLKLQQLLIALELTLKQIYRPFCHHFHVKALGNDVHILRECHEAALEQVKLLSEESIQIQVAKNDTQNT